MSDVTVPPALPPSILQLLITTFFNAEQVKYVAASVLALLIYDWAIFFSQEIALIWNSAWSVPKVAYLLSRYYGIIHFSVVFFAYSGLNVGLGACQAYFKFDTAGSLLFTFVGDLVLCLRIQALYGSKHFVSIASFFLLICNIITSTTIAALVIRGAVVYPIAGLSIPGCLVGTTAGNLALSAWFPTMGIGLFYFLAMFFKCYSMWRVTKSNSPLLSRFMRDGTLFFCLNFLAILINCIMVLSVKSGLITIAIYFQNCVYCCTTCHLILNLRATNLARAETYSNGPSTLRFQKRVPELGGSMPIESAQTMSYPVFSENEEQADGPKKPISHDAVDAFERAGDIELKRYKHPSTEEGWYDNTTAVEM